LTGTSRIFWGQRRTFYSGSNGHFLICHATFQKPANGDREKLLRYMSHRWCSLMHVLVLGTLPQFLQGAKTAILAKFSTRFSIGGLLFHKGKEYGKLKITFSSLTIVLRPHQIWWGRLNSHRVTLTQSGVGRPVLLADSGLIAFCSRKENTKS